jgi:hypothetical protein
LQLLKHSHYNSNAIGTTTLALGTDCNSYAIGTTTLDHNSNNIRTTTLALSIEPRDQYYFKLGYKQEEQEKERLYDLSI